VAEIVAEDRVGIGDVAECIGLRRRAESEKPTELKDDDSGEGNDHRLRLKPYGEPVRDGGSFP
jgi:hypothetical protein